MSRVFECGERVLITDVVLAETVWTLSTQRYRATRADLTDLVNELLQDANMCIEDDEVVWSALQAFRRTKADFSAAPTVCKARKTAAEADGDELSAFCAFDDEVLQLPGTVEP